MGARGSYVQVLVKEKGRGKSQEEAVINKYKCRYKFPVLFPQNPDTTNQYICSIPTVFATLNLLDVCGNSGGVEEAEGLYVS